MRINEITAQAVGKWDYIFQSLGIEVGNGKHCPCPVCGGKDRFRFDNQNGRGTYICNQCGSGDGLELIKNYYYCDAKEASSKVAECLNLSNPNNKIRENLAFRNIDSEQLHNNNIPDNPVCKKVEYLLSKATLGQSDYLTKKGLTFDLPLLDNGRIFAPMLNLHNEYAGGQFIELDGSKHLMKSSSKKGAFILATSILSRPAEVCANLLTHNEIIICEGLATGISIAEFRQQSTVISAIDAGNLIHVAKDIRELNPTAKIIIAGDNDIGQSPNTGLAKAIEAAQAVNGYYSVPDTDYKCDWDDYRQQFGSDNTLAHFNKNLIKPELSTMTKHNMQNELSSMNLSQMASSQRAELLNQYYDNNLAINLTTDEIYHYQDNAWQPISDKVLMRTLADLFTQSGEPFNPMRISSAVESLRLSLPIMGTPQKDLICFKNGVYELKSQTFRPHNKQDWLLVSNDIDYYPAKENESFDTHAPNFAKWLKRASGNQDKAKNILAALYMILANRHDWQLFLEVTGAGGSGKSVFAEIATMLAGKNNTVIGTMDALEKARDRALIVGYSLVILPDQPRYMGSGAGLKAITDGDEVAIDPKHKQPYSCKIPAVVLVINNEAMRFNERNGGISRRRVIFHFSEVIPEKERDLNLVSKIEQELPSIVRLLLNEFTSPAEAKERLHQQQQSDEATAIKRESDHLVDFCSYLDVLDHPNGMFIGNMGIMPFNPRKYLYHAYIEYVRNTGLNNPLSLSGFGLSLNYAVKENRKAYIKKRTNIGVKTNLEINPDMCKDWLPKAEDPN
ncbi:MULTISPECIES: primase-helicase zinc-binding domain-containing protein [unclassified Gilliamella]|uniref:primase-helicase zinc-binding domain-containing protein n=1 Tax=unclassified Gilliamella TaxID=2685620 RepID=UPI001305B0B6|nr:MULTISPECIES: primase-helicase zinc-binding domain-containing protein [unclassified Gilliamella]MWP48447.1 DNA primase [Gilliamella sp. Lep-s35]MWP68274.1 DNA primase [Gilliamella sp. Lep-s5]MWP76587.1 DNA primase [Gilliamella sp. Lep-s21]